MNRSNTFHDELVRINDIVVAARDLIADGQLINLTPLEDEVTRICQGLEGISGTEVEKIKPALLSLMDELDRLADEMRSRQAEYESELRTLASHKNAARAYHAVPRPEKTRK